jgi:hypothetical protein
MLSISFRPHAQATNGASPRLAPDFRKTRYSSRDETPAPADACPTEDSAMFTAPERYGHMANCLPWRRMKHKAISHCGFIIDDFRLPTLDHWQNDFWVNAGVSALLSRDLASARILS